MKLDPEDDASIPDYKINITVEEVRAKPRMLRGVWGPNHKLVVGEFALYRPTQRVVEITSTDQFNDGRLDDDEMSYEARDVVNHLKLWAGEKDLGLALNGMEVIALLSKQT